MCERRRVNPYIWCNGGILTNWYRNCSLSVRFPLRIVGLWVVALADQNDVLQFVVPISPSLFSCMRVPHHPNPNYGIFTRPCAFAIRHPFIREFNPFLSVTPPLPFLWLNSSGHPFGESDLELNSFVKLVGRWFSPVSRAVAAACRCCCCCLFLGGCFCKARLPFSIRSPYLLLDTYSKQGGWTFRWSLGCLTV